MSTPSALIKRLPAALLLLPFLLAAPPAPAFPPAPFYTLYGTVRDEIGTVIQATDAKVILLKGTEVVQKTPITVGLNADQNYELRIPIDMLRPATTLYRDAAIVARSGYQIAVEMNGQRYYPVGVASSLTSGGGSERERFDFTLGVDSDTDGLPDIWEEWQLSTTGDQPGEEGWDLTKLTRTGDLDKDGASDFDEYIQGTYAADGSSRLWIEFKENTATYTRFEFTTAIGRTYTLERSTDLVAWVRVPFSIGQLGRANEAFVANAAELISAFVVPGPEKRVFYRLVIK